MYRQQGVYIRKVREYDPLGTQNCAWSGQGPLYREGT